MTQTTLSAALGRYPHTAALFDGSVTSPTLRLDIAAVAPISRAFAPMVREARFDVCEMAIATFLMAKAAGKPLVLLPLAMTARFQEPALLCRADSAIAGPADLRGRRVGVRAYSQTTGLWLRGRLQEVQGVAPEEIRWVTFEDAHLAEYRDPPFVTRAAPGQDMLAMLQAGELDAAIFGNELPAVEGLRPVYADCPAEAAAFTAAHGFVPVNHLVVVREDLARQRPEVIAELLQMFRRAREGSPLPSGRTALAAPITLAMRYALEQGLLPHPLTLDAVWEGLPATVWNEDA